jgi:Zn-dependent membrane protease YugP
MSRQQALRDVRREVAEMDERRHLPEGEAPPRWIERRFAVPLVIIMVVGVFAVAIAAYMLDGLGTMMLALALMFALVTFAALPAWLATAQRAKEEEKIEERVEKRLERDELHDHDRPSAA